MDRCTITAFDIAFKIIYRWWRWWYQIFNLSCV